VAVAAGRAYRLTLLSDSPRTAPVLVHLGFVPLFIGGPVGDRGATDGALGA
jgi:hypothetical protein